MSQKLLVNDFKWVENISGINESLIKCCNEKCGEGYFFNILFVFLKEIILFCYIKLNQSKKYINTNVRKIKTISFSILGVAKFIVKLSVIFRIFSFRNTSLQLFL